MLEKKALPLLDFSNLRTTLDNVLPPVSTYTQADGKQVVYTYFRDQQSCPFRHDSGSFELVNAWWLADAAMLAYSGENPVRQAFEGIADLGAFFSGKTTQCYVAVNDRFAVVSFRGTQAPKQGQRLQDILIDWFMDSQIALVDSGHGGFVHSGFKKGVEEIWKPPGEPGLLPYLKELQAKNPKLDIWFTGHSLGAALATLAADWFGAAKGVFTYGSPLVGDGDFVASYSTPAYRFVNDQDLVTHVPVSGPYIPPRLREFGHYKHVVGPMEIDAAGQIHDNTQAAPPMEYGLPTVLRSYFTLHGLLHRNLANDAVLGRLIDHAPLLYCLHIWNALVDSRQGALS